METQMKIRESCLQNGIFNYKQGISITKQDFYLQIGSLGLQTGFSACYSPGLNFFEAEYHIYLTKCRVDGKINLRLQVCRSDFTL